MGVNTGSDWCFKHAFLLHLCRVAGKMVRTSLILRGEALSQVGEVIEPRCTLEKAGLRRTPGLSGCEDHASFPLSLMLSLQDAHRRTVVPSPPAERWVLARSIPRSRGRPYAPSSLARVPLQVQDTCYTGTPGSAAAFP